MSDEFVFEVRDLDVWIGRGNTARRLVEGVSLSVRAGEIVGVLGESGCGKTLTMQALLGVLPGGLWSAAEELTVLGEPGQRSVRAHAAYVPADAGMALNPLERAGHQVEDGMRVGRSRLSRRSRIARVLEVFTSVGLRDAKGCAKAYPHELSGGMQQRVVIAIGVEREPVLLIADEPTTALDVTVQAQVLSLLLDLHERTGCAIVLVTHDITTVAEMCQRAVVMYAGQVVETGTVRQVCLSPRHPYSRGLIDAVPPLGGVPPEQLRTIEGSPPDPSAWPSGCRFAPRCELYRRLGRPERCIDQMPELLEIGGEHLVRCHFWDRIDAQTDALVDDVQSEVANA